MYFTAMLHAVVIYAAFRSAAAPVVSNSSSHAHAAKLAALSKSAYTLNETGTRYNPVRKRFCEMLLRVLSEGPQRNQTIINQTDDPSCTTNDDVFSPSESPLPLWTTISQSSGSEEATQSREEIYVDE